MKLKLSKKNLIIFICVLILIILVFLFKCVIRNNLIDTISNYQTYYKLFCSEKELKIIDSIETGENVNLVDLFYLLGNSKRIVDNCNTIDGVTRIVINTKDGNGNSLEQSDGYIDCSIYVISEKEVVIEDTDSKIKIRGNSTAFGDKKPYNIKFSKKRDLLSFGENKKWCLLSECFDPTLLRNYVFQTLAKEMELEYTSSCEYVDVIMDNNYLGTYLLIEPVYAGKYGVDIDINNGEFIIEYEEEKNEDDKTYFNIGNEFRFVMCDPEDPTQDQLRNIREVMTKIYDALILGEYNNITELIDEESFAKYYVLNEYSKKVDFWYSSVKFYYKDNKLYAGPCWDYDISSGNANPSYYSDYFGKGTYYDKKDLTNSYMDLYCQRHIFEYLTKHSEFMQKVGEIFNEYSYEMKNVYETGGLIDSTVSKYSDLFSKNYLSKKQGGAGWIVSKNYSQYSYNPLETYVDNVNVFKMWIDKRYEYLETQFIQ